jgi:hypothetical protein
MSRSAALLSGGTAGSSRNTRSSSMTPQPVVDPLAVRFARLSPPAVLEATPDVSGLRRELVRRQFLAAAGQGDRLLKQFDQRADVPGHGGRRPTSRSLPTRRSTSATKA